MSERVVRAIITGSSAGAVKAFEETAVAAEATGNKVTGKFSKMGALISNPYVVAGAAVAAAVVGIASESLKMATSYQTATDAMAAKAGITQEAAQKIGNAFLSTAFQSTFSAQTIMDAFGPVAGQLALLAGHALNSAEAMGVMSAASNLAEASGSDLTTTTAALAQVMQAYQIPLASAAYTSDVLFNTSRGLNVPLADLVGTVDKLHAKLGPLSPSLADTSALMLDLASHGLTGNKALNLVSTGFNTLLGGSKTTNAEISKLHLNLYTASGQFVGMQSVITQLAPKLAHMTEQHRLLAEKELFGAGASKALDATLLAGVAAFDKSRDAAGKAGTAQTAAQTATDNLKGAFDRAKAGVQDFMTRIGAALIPVLTTLVNWFSNSVMPALNAFWRTIQDHMPQIQNGFRIFGNVVTTTFTIMKNVITVVIQVIIAIISTLVKVIQNIVPVVNAVVIRVGVIIGVMITVFRTMGTIVGGIIGVVVAVVGGIITAVGAVVKAVQTSPIGNVFGHVFGFAAGAIGWIITGVSAAIGGISTALGAVLSWSGWKTIGGVFGAVFGAIATAVGAVVTAVEAVIGAVQHLLDLLNKLPKSNLPSGFQGTNPLAPGFVPGAHALGGPVQRLQSILVGEQGPELFTPGTAGYITPNNRLGGDGGASATANHYYNIVVNGNDPQAVVNALRRYMQQNGALPVSVKAAQRVVG